MSTVGVLNVLGGAVAMTAVGVALALPANAGPQVVNRDRCVAQSGVYSVVGTSRSCTVTTSAAPQDAIQFLDAPVGAEASAAYIQLVTFTDTTTTTKGSTTTTSSTSRVTIASGSTCASGTVLEIFAHTAAPVDCSTVGLPDGLLNGPNPIFILS